MGRRSTYDPERHLPFIKMLAEKGCTDREIYKAIGIAEKTFYTWREKYQQLEQTLKEARFQPLREVEASLFKRAVGYEYSETTLERTESGDMVVTKIVQKQMAPNVTAQIFWTINRSDGKWKDVRSARAGMDADSLRELFEAMALTAEEMQREDEEAQKFRPTAIEDMKDVSPGHNGGNGNGNGH